MCSSSSDASTKRLPPGRARSTATATRSIAATSTRRSAARNKSSQKSERCITEVSSPRQNAPPQRTRGTRSFGAVRFFPRVLRVPRGGDLALPAPGPRTHEPTKPRKGRGFPGVLIVAVWCAGCAAPLVKLPTGPGTPASDAADALTDAVAACRAVSTLSAEVGVSGSVGGRRLRGSLLVGVAPPASARIEAVAPAGQPIFIFVASGNDATLLLPRDNRVLRHGRPDAVLEAVAGPPLGAVELRETLTGCVLSAGGAKGGELRRGPGNVSVGSAHRYLPPPAPPGPPPT